MSVIARHPSRRHRSTLRHPATRSGSRTGPVLLFVLLTALFVLPPEPTSAYKVCTDPNEPCFHETMAHDAATVYAAFYGGGGIGSHLADLRAGAGGEDNDDHIFGFEKHIVFADSFVTSPHFWDVDAGATAEVSFVDLYSAPFEWPLVGSGPYKNSFQKAQALWMLALGEYAEGRHNRAYQLLGHIAHLVGDLTIPTHTHNDAHPPFDDDPFEEWMSGNGDGASNAHPLTNAERGVVIAQGALQIPDNVDKLYWIMNTTGQIADFFASADVDGDAIDPHRWVQSQLDDMNLNISSPRVRDQLDDNDDGNNDDDGDLSRIRFYSYFRGIRATAALYKLFEDTIAQRPSLTVVFDRIEEDEDHDLLDGPDYWAKVFVDGSVSQNRGNHADDNNDLHPGWAFAREVGLTGQANVAIEVWDFNGQTGTPEIELVYPEDLQSDVAIGPARTLNLQVDIGKCLRREPGAITGLPNPGDCGAPLVSESDADDNASKLYFHIKMSKSPPTAEAGGPYTTDEGTNVRLDGTGSTDPDNDIVSHTWDFNNDGICDDATGATPDFTAVGQDGIYQVKLCVRDAIGLTAEDTASVTVRNVAPTVGITPAGPVAENEAVTIGGTISDPGWLDTLTATIAWGDGTAAAALGGTLENIRPDATLTYSASHTYGDNGTFTVQVCGFDGKVNPCATTTVTVTNTNPTVAIDLSGAINVNGNATIIAHAGAAVAFNGRTTDPGSDDLTLTWIWGDGTPNASQISRVNPPNLDPAVSPSIQPRNEPFPQSHTFGSACIYESRFTALDDDTGTAAASVNVVIVGNNHPNRPHGYWKQQFRSFVVGQGPSDFTAATLGCYLRVVGYMSRMFSEQTAASTLAQAYAVLDTGPPKPIQFLFDVQLLAAWLNFANGAIEHNRLVDTNGDRFADTPFLTAISAAESLRLNPAATVEQLDRMKRIVESWTNLP